jgi:predicted RNase H-like HicB family nuclease
MKEREFTAVYEQDGEWIFASAPELPGAFGQGRTVEEARDDLNAAILLMLEELGECAEQAARTAFYHERLTVAVA